MATVNIITNPATYSPVNAEIWFLTDSASSGSTDFKYIYDLNKVNYVTNNSTFLGRFVLPPRPLTGYGQFTPHKLLRSQVSYDINPTITEVTSSMNSIVEYNIGYGYQYNPSITFSDITNGNNILKNSYFGSTASWELNSLWTISGGAATCTASNGNSLAQSSVCTIGDDYSIEINIEYLNGTLTLAIGGGTTYVITSAGFYSDIVLSNVTGDDVEAIVSVGGNAKVTSFRCFHITGNTWLSMDGTSDIIAGDVVSITLDNTSVNPGFGGTSSVLNSSTQSGYQFVEINKSYISSSSYQSGTIDFLLRMVGTSSNFFAYNGTRQYNEIKIDFSDERVFYANDDITYPLTNYKTFNVIEPNPIDANAKTVFVNQFETLSVITNNKGITTQLITNPHMIYGNSGWTSYGPDGCGVYCSVLVDNTLTLGVPDASCSTAVQFATNSTTFVPGRNYIVTVAVSTVNNPSGSFQYVRSRIGGGTIGAANQGTGTFTEVLTCGAGTQYSLEMNLADADTGGYGSHAIKVSSIEIYDTDGLNLIYSFYDSSKNPLGSYITAMTSSTFANRFDIPVGPGNIDAMSLTFSNYEYYEVALRYGTDKMKQLYRIVDNCSPYPRNWRVIFQNRQGGMDYWNFNYKSTNVLNTQKNEWRKVLAYDYNVGARQDTILSQKANETYIISTDWITEYDSNYLKELITSPEVFIYDEDTNEIYPIIILDNSYQVKTSIDNKLFALSITFKYAFDINLQQS